ncbi:MAG: Crp/Fnr family transcriptional regulator [Clostridia bacterium]|nr:Crp/Fnr family transcriptional regulator [Clostridia bacterium]
MASTLSAFFLFRGIGDEERQRITARLERPVTFRRGQVVYNTHTFRRAIGLILSGSVIVRSSGEAAHSVVINRLHTGEIFGVAALFDSASDDYVTEITADEETAVQFIPQELMARLIAEFPTIAEQYIRFLSGRIRFLNRKLSALTNGNAENRLYHYLLAHQDEQGTIRLPGTMTELANTLNMGRSSLYRSLDTLVREGILVKEGKTYRIS